MEENFIQQFRNQSLDQLFNLQPESIVLFDNSKIPSNYTLVARPTSATLEIFEKLYGELQSIDPHQYYYPTEDLHLTLIGNLPLTVDTEDFIEAVNLEITNFRFNFKLYGLGSNKYCSSISAYPLNFSLHEFRDKIRNKIGAHGDDYSSILESYEYVGWFNYLRYLKKPSEEFLKKLYSYKDSSFGEVQPSTIQLYKNTSKVLSNNQAELLHTFNI